MRVNLKDNNGSIVQATVGFSWTFFFFGFWVPLFRGDIKWFVITLVAAFFTFGLSQLVFMFIYNGLYIKDLVKKGYKPVDEFNKSILMGRGVYFD